MRHRKGKHFGTACMLCRKRRAEYARVVGGFTVVDLCHSCSKQHDKKEQQRDTTANKASTATHTSIAAAD